MRLGAGDAGKRAMDCHRLGRVFDTAYRSQLSVCAQRIFEVAVSATHATDPDTVPMYHAVEQTHRSCMRDHVRDLGSGENAQQGATRTCK
jgi:hypothetical protein